MVMQLVSSLSEENFAGCESMSESNAGASFFYGGGIEKMRRRRRSERILGFDGGAEGSLKGGV